MSDVRYFLLVYDRARSKLVEVREFDDDGKASEEYARLEAEHRADANVEIVLIGSDSLETVKQTHSNYFSDDRETVETLVAGA